MELHGYLVVRKVKKGYYYDLNARFIKTQPALDSNEISVRLECNIPDELFSRPSLKFKIDIPKEAVPQKEINAEVTGNIQDIIKQNLGIEVHLIAEPVKEEE